ncbi:PREDICTED: AAA-ATPase At3g50940-like [Ipomoea nil]|uniref:AAA-ATPase At3g50940-like n=1 Tax=Ipomoea nil TaxID=35883 RepID=UPI0009014783|nr:PREDICTED: AAA-ATPase At3g50940-like [Ipomoea nil]
MISNVLSDHININMASAKTIVSTAASVAASAMVVRSLARDLIPYELQQYVYLNINLFFKSFSSDMVLIINEYDGLGNNQIYKAAEIYLGSKVSNSISRFRVSMPEKETKISTSVDRNQEEVDFFNGVKLKWRQVTVRVENKRSSWYPGQSSGGQESEIRYFRLIFHKKHKNMVLDSYFPFILNESNKVKEERKTLKIYTMNSEHMRRVYSSSGDYTWNSINLDHPSTFETLAIDPELKKTIMEDLDRFVRRRDYYRKVGKAWKRGYLLYGPPGTGKSSLIAAMANYLKFDIYDLELTGIHANSELRRILLATGNRSILVVEDIDCSLDIEDGKADKQALKMLRDHVSQAQTINIVRKPKPQEVTLSGLLNFIDGLWSSCGDERIIVFTTNHKERLEPALLRPGRMDVHIHMSYCTPAAFMTLADNYLGIQDHSLFPEIQLLLENVNVTPAEVGEQLLRNEGVEEALNCLLHFLQEKTREADESKEKAKAMEEQDAEHEEPGETSSSSH